MHLVRLARHLQREAAVVGEGVEHAPARVAARREVVLALVEEEAGLLPLAQVDAAAARPPRSPRRRPAPRRGATETVCSRPSSARTRGSLRSTMPRGFSSSTSAATISAFGALRALRERLDREVVAVAVDHERRQAVALAVDDAVRLGARPPPSRASAAPARSGRAGSSRASVSPRSIMRRRISERDDQNAKPSGSPRTPATRTTAPGEAPPSFSMSERKTQGCPRSMRA